MRKEKAMQKVRAAAVCFLVVFSLGAAGEICGVFFEGTEKAFSNLFPDNNPKDIRYVLKRIGENTTSISGTHNSFNIPIAVMTVSGESRAVEAVNLSTSEQMWRAEIPVNSAVTLAKNLAIWKSGKEIVAYRLNDGLLMWRYKLEEGWNYYGADSDSDVVAISIGVGGLEPGGYANGKIILLKASSGARLWERNAGSGILGKPVIIGNMIFVPWDRQKIVVLDTKRGEEICRVRAADFAINFVDKTKNAVFYGALATVGGPGSVFRLNELSAVGTAEGSTSFTPTLKAVPGDPHFGRDSYSLSNGGRATEEKIRFHYEPAQSFTRTVELEGNIFYLHYWSYIIAFDADTNTVRWVYRSQENIESMDVVTGGGIVAVDTNGTVFYLDPLSGEQTWRLNTKEKILTAVFDANGFVPTKSSAKTTDPVKGLMELIVDRDNRLLPIRIYAVGLLGAIQQPEITKKLLSIYTDTNVPKMLRDSIVKVIEKRSIGAEYLVDALDMKYDYLEGTQPPPMKLVAPALINMKEKQAVPALLNHLMNHETPIDGLLSIITALHALGDQSVAEPLMKFITWYHADTSFLGNEQILAGAAYTLMKFGEKEITHKFISQIRDNNQTLVELRKLLRGVLDPELVAKEAEEKKAKEEAEKKAAEEKARLDAEAAFVPDTLSKEQIHETISQNREFLAPCIKDAIRKTSDLRQIRLRFSIIGETGKTSDVKVLPHNIDGLNECINNAFSKIQFRKFATPRQLTTYTININSAN